jgi:hypothetical protein
MVGLERCPEYKLGLWLVLMERVTMFTAQSTRLIWVPHVESIKDWFVERVTMFTVQSTWLIWVGSVEQHVVFPIFWTEEHCERLCGEHCHVDDYITNKIGVTIKEKQRIFLSLFSSR